MTDTDRESVKQKWPVGGYAPGSYWCKCHQCENTFTGDKRAFQCPDCVIRELLSAKEAAEAKIDACAEYLKDRQDPADRLAQNHREICSLLEMLAEDRKRAEAAEAKLAAAVEAMREVDERANRTYRARNGKMCSIEADDGEACEIVHSDALFQLRATLAQIKPKEGTDNDG